MPNAWTFTIKPIRDLLKEEVTDGLWCDPFAGKNSPAQVTNDLNPERDTTYHLDALEFLKLIKLKLQLQACNDDTCLAPESVPIIVSMVGQ